MTTVLKISINLIIALLLIPNTLLGADDTDTKSNKLPVNCVITVKSTKKSGGTLMRIFQSHTDSDVACKKMARAHQTNFAPQVFSKVQASSKWKK